MSRSKTGQHAQGGEVGDLSNMSFAEWLISAERHEAYTNFDAKTCHHCQFHKQNEVINYLVDTPEHVEFV